MKRAVLAVVFIFICAMSCEAQAPNPASPQPPPAFAVGRELRKTVGQLRVAFSRGDEQKEVKGTCFFVYYPDERVGKDRGWIYLVTNRHVADPSADDPEHVKIHILSTNVLLNRKDGLANSEQPLIFSDSVRWYFPDDPAVDLAVLPWGPLQANYETTGIPVSLFATKDVVAREMVGEGDTIIFAGVFVQAPGMKFLEPIVREGTVAMMPDEQLETTLHAAGDLYLADMHVFHGNSGSPVLVRLGGVRNGQISLYTSYALLGVVSGFYHEDSDLTLTIASTAKGKIEANSGIALVVPADELKKILDGPSLKALRDAYFPDPHLRNR